MYVPKDYQTPDDRAALRLIREQPLATLLTNGPEVPWATHLPVIVPAELDPERPLAGQVLLGHLNRANPHWTALRDGPRGVLVFQGPHGYVSPHVYQVNPAAPTWNFTSVHVHGTVRPMPGKDAAMRVVRATVATFEDRFGHRWDDGESLGYFQRMIGGVGAFEFHIDSVDSMFKLSQEKEPEIRERVADSFAASPLGSHRELAALMRDTDGRP